MNAGCRPGQSYACTADGVAVFLHAVTGVKTAGETDGTRRPRPAAAASVDNTDTGPWVLLLPKTYSIVVEKPLTASTFRRGKFVHEWQFVLFPKTYSIRGTFVCTKAASTSQWTETICLYIFPILKFVLCTCMIST